MSLINQVLQNVEARQGSTALDSKSDAGWAGQVKPVLSHQGSSASVWIRRLVWGVLILVLAGWLLVHWSQLMAYFRPTLVPTPEKKAVVSAVTTALPAALVVPESAPTVPLANQDLAAPQLTKSLFSPWQATPANAATPAAVRSKPAITKSGATQQVEGEFSIKPAETATANPVVSAIAPPLEAVNTVKQAKTDEGESSPGGIVNKQIRPDQEVNLLIQRAVDHEQKGRLNEALVTLRQALTTYPQSEDARQLLAAYLFESKQEPEAVAVLQAGIKHYPGQIGLAKSLAKWQLAHGQADAVLQTLKSVANLLIQDAESQWMLAMAYQQTGQHAAALPHFERATTLRPAQAPWMVAYAISLQAAGQSAQALQQLQQAYNLPLSERMAEFVSQRIRQLGGTVPTRSE